MNKVVHFEMPAKDLRRASKFYEEVFGWKLEEWQPGYMMATTGETDEKTGPKTTGFINGAIQTADETTKAPVLAMAVESIDEHIGKVEKAGGKLVSAKVAIGEMGFYAKVEDSEGNVIGLWQDAGH